jgi:hypothetical protein
MILKLLWALAFAPVVLGQLCCPNGAFNGDPSLLCNNPNIARYGHLQCYQQYEINCDGYYDAQNLLDGTALNDQTIAGCFDYCTINNPGFLSLQMQSVLFIDNVVFCVCFADEGPFIADNNNYGAQYCPQVPSTTTAATPTATPSSCCSNGIFTDDLENACNLIDPSYGDGQCYGHFEIHCDGVYLEYTTQPNSAQYSGAYTIADCFEYCRDYGGDSTAVDWIRHNDEIPQLLFCYCLTGQSEFVALADPNEYSPGISMSYCSTGPSTNPLPCCEPFTGDQTQLCLNPLSSDYGDGKCVLDEHQQPYRVSDSIISITMKY